MKFVFLKKEMESIVSQAEGVIIKKPTTPILKNLKIESRINESGSGEIWVSSTDLEVSYRGRFDGEVEKEGEITVQAKNLLDILKSFPDIPISFDLNKKNSQVNIQSKDRERVDTVFNIFGTESKDYPNSEFGTENSDRFLIDIDILKEMVGRVITCVAKDEDRYYLNGIFLEKKGNNLNFISTNGNILGFTQQRDFFKDNKIKDFGIIIPTKTFDVMGKIFPYLSGDCEIYVSEENIFFRFDNVEIMSLLLEGHFPDYEKIIPTEFKSTMKIKSDDLVDGLNRVSNVIHPKELKIFMDFKLGKLHLNGRSVELGEARDVIKCETQGEIKMAFNYKYILNSVKSISEYDVFIKINEYDTPTMILGEEEGFFYIVMPMRLQTGP